MPARARAAGLAVVAAILAALPGCASVDAVDPTPLVLSSADRVNLALKYDPRSAKLNFLNGLVYESRSAVGSEGRELARIGYQMALRMDVGFWPADYQLGQLALEERQALEAQVHLLAAARQAPHEARVFYALARASYCAGDPLTAQRALARALALKPADDAESHETAALVSASAGDAAGLAEWLVRHARMASPQAQRELRSRVEEPPEIVELAEPSPLPAASAAGDKVAAGAARGTRAKRHTALVDVVILRRNEVRSTNLGINLLDALKLQFGGTLLNTTWNRTIDRQQAADSIDSVARSKNLLLTIPAISYSLNIANAQSGSSTIEARPTLLISDGSVSKIFTGGTLTYASEGQFASNSFTKEVGLSLSVKPEFVTDNLVNLTVATTLEVFSTAPPPGSFRQTLQTEKSATELSTDLRFGETVIVYGGHTTQSDQAGSKTPGLGDVPLVSLAFNARDASRSENGLLILLTLRDNEVHGEVREAAQRRLIAELGARVFRLPNASPAPAVRVDRKPRRPGDFQLSNPGRTFDPGYLAGIGIDTALLQTPPPAASR